MTDDEIRSMLRTKAAEATVSDDAWQQIAARIAEPAPGRTGRRLAVAGVAVAAAAATVFVANVPGSPTSSVADDPTTTAAPVVDPAVIEEPHVFAAPQRDWTMEQTAHAFLLEVTDLDAGGGLAQQTSADSGTVTYLDGPVAAEVFLRRLQGGWVVDSAASDLVPIHDPVFEDGLLSAEVVAEADGELELTVGGAREDGRESVEVRAVSFRQQVPVRSSLPDARYARVQAVLRTEDGTTAVSATWVSGAAVDPASPASSYVAIWPATDRAGLAELQRQADAGERPDLLDPNEVASRFLAEQEIDGATTQPFQLGDSTSAEVPYAIDGGASGTLLLRRSGGEGSVWYVTGATSADLRIEKTRREETHLVADVRSEADGTLTWTGATPVEVRASQIVSIGRPDTPVGDHPVVVHLVRDGRTVALAATID